MIFRLVFPFRIFLNDTVFYLRFKRLRTPLNSITNNIANYSDLKNNERNISINTHALRKSHAEKCLRKDLIDR